MSTSSEHNAPGDTRHIESTESIEPRQSTGRFARKSTTALSKLMWPAAMVIAGVVVYNIFASDAAKNAKKPVVEEPQEIRPVPRKQAAELRFMPSTTVVVATPTQALPPLPSDVAAAPMPAGAPPAPAVDPAKLEAERKAAAEEKLRRRRMAPMMAVAVNSSTGAVVASSNSAAQDGVVLDRSGSQASQSASKPQGPASGASGQSSTPHDLLRRSADDSDQFKPAKVRAASNKTEYTVSEGKMISAVLETAIHTDQPGYVRAMVDEDLYAESGRRVVIPKMSRLVGEYETRRVAVGQTRIMVVWRRAILPDGKSLILASYGTDGLGRAGMTGDVDNHYFQRFGASFLISMLGIIASRTDNTATIRPDGGGGYVVEDRWAELMARREALRSLQGTTNAILASQATIRPTIQVPQGSRVRVFVSRDLDFSPEAHATAR